MEKARLKLLELTPTEQQAADREAKLLAIARKLNGPNAPSIKDLFPDAIRISNLEAGASGGEMHRVKLALKDGEDVNGPCVHYATPLHAAAQNGHLEVVRLLVAFDAEVDARDENGKCAADVAAKPEIAKFLRLCK